MNEPEDVEAAEIARIERVFSKGGGKPLTSPKPTSQPQQQQPANDQLKKTTSQGMPLKGSSFI
jgi:hypothetical protein